MRVHASDRGQLDGRQRVVPQPIGVLLRLLRLLRLLHGLQLAAQQVQLRDGRPRGLQNHVHLESVVLAAEQRLLVLVPTHVLRVTRGSEPHDVREVLRARRLRHQVVVQHQAVRVRSLRPHAPRDLRRELVVGGRGALAGVDLLPGERQRGMAHLQATRAAATHLVLADALLRQVVPQVRHHRVPDMQQVRHRREQLAERQDPAVVGV